MPGAWATALLLHGLQDPGPAGADSWGCSCRRTPVFFLPLLS